MSQATTTNRDPVRVLIADDHALFRGGLREILEDRGCVVVGEARDGEEAVRHALAMTPGVILMDLHMPRCSGVEATRRIVASGSKSQIVMLTVSSAQPDVLDALVAGAAGYLLKDAPIEDIVAAVDAAAEGSAVVSPAVAARLIARVREGAVSHGEAPAPVPELSPREVEVLRLLAAGRENPEIAASLYISTSTVKTHISTILRKLGVDNRIEAAVHAVEHRLL